MNYLGIYIFLAVFFPLVSVNAQTRIYPEPLQPEIELNLESLSAPEIPLHYERRLLRLPNINEQEKVQRIILTPPDGIKTETIQAPSKIVLTPPAGVKAITYTPSPESKPIPLAKPKTIVSKAEEVIPNKTAEKEPVKVTDVDGYKEPQNSNDVYETLDYDEDDDNETPESTPISTVSKQEDKPLEITDVKVDKTEPKEEINFKEEAQDSVSEPAQEIKEDVKKEIKTPTIAVDGGEHVLSVYFEEGTVSLSDKAREDIKAIATMVKIQEDTALHLISYAKGEGPSDSKARRESLTRALSVRSLLMDNGIRRIEVKALGNVPAGDGEDRLDIFTVKR